MDFNRYSHKPPIHNKRNQQQQTHWESFSKGNISSDNNTSITRSNSFRVKKSDSFQSQKSSQNDISQLDSLHIINDSNNWAKRILKIYSQKQDFKQESKHGNYLNEKDNKENKENIPQQQKLLVTNQITTLKPIKKVIGKRGSEEQIKLTDQCSFQKKVDLIDIRLRLKFPPPKVTAKCWAIFEVSTCKMIWGQKCHNQREVASLTKIMTFMTAMKLCKIIGIKPQQTYFRVSQQAANMQGTSASLQNGTYLSVNDLYYALMLPSGNDAAIVIAENLGAIYYYHNQADTCGTIQELINNKDKKYELAYYLSQLNHPVALFVNEMNKYAKELGITNSIWANPHGLNNKYNKSSAYDIARLTSKALAMPAFKKVVGTKKYQSLITLPNGQLYEQSWTNTNKLLDEGWDGAKTGITPNAGPCLSASCTVNILDSKEECQFVVVILKSQSMEHRWEECKVLINWIVEHFQ